MGNVFKGFAASRKFWLIVLSAVVPFVNKKFSLGLSVEELATSIAPFVAGILGIAYEDAAAKSNPSKK